MFRLRSIVVVAVATVTTLVTASTAPAAAAAESVTTSRTYSYDFSSSAQGWKAGFADYSPDNGDLQLRAGIAPLPAGTASGNGYFIQGVNRSDDLYMFLKRRLGPSDGIVRGKRYSVRTSVTFWTDSSADCFGVGGSPGGSVFLKAGASTQEPRVFLNGDNHYQVSIDKGQQASGGTDAAALGNIDNGLLCDDRRWVKVVRSSSTDLTVRASSLGYLWLNAGTDSGFEGLTQLYYSTISVTLTPLGPTL